MPTPTFFLIAAAAAGLWYGGEAVYHGAQKAGHAIVQAGPKIGHVLKHGLRKHEGTKARTATR